MQTKLQGGAQAGGYEGTHRRARYLRLTAANSSSKHLEWVLQSWESSLELPCCSCLWCHCNTFPFSGNRTRCQGWWKHRYFAWVCFQGSGSDSSVCDSEKRAAFEGPSLPSKKDKTTTVHQLCWKRNGWATLQFLLMSRADWGIKQKRPTQVLNYFCFPQISLRISAVTASSAQRNWSPFLVKHI